MKVAVVLLADTNTPEAMGRMANALMVVRELKESGEDVRLILDGAGVKWVSHWLDQDSQYGALFLEVRDRLAGVCRYCANAYGVAQRIEAAGFPFADQYKQHPSFRAMIAEGYQIITF